MPKGPSKDPSDKRLAIAAEDHPLDYADFEGEIPEGEYGAGTVQIWDRGRYRNRRAYGRDRHSMNDAVDEGLVEVTLNGGNLNGGYALKRIRGKGDAKQGGRRPRQTEAGERNSRVAATARSLHMRSCRVDRDSEARPHSCNTHAIPPWLSGR